MLTGLAGRVGFVPPNAGRRTIKRRARALQLFATVALAFALIVAMTAVSIGIARADAFGAGAQGGHASLALALLLGLFFAGMGGLTTLVALAGSQREKAARDAGKQPRRCGSV